MIFAKIINVIKSTYYNLKLFPFPVAIKFPLIVGNKCKIEAYRGSIIIDGDIRRKMFSFGISGSMGIQENAKCGLYISGGGKLFLHGSVDFGAGSVIRIEKDGVLEIGNGFYANKNCFISVSTHCLIGSDVLLGWNVNLRDSDGHAVFQNNKQTNTKKSFKVDDHVWIASYVDLLKGAEIPKNCVVAYRACVTRKFSETNTIIAGFPAKVVTNNVTWQR